MRHSSYVPMPYTRFWCRRPANAWLLSSRAITFGVEQPTRYTFDIVGSQNLLDGFPYRRAYGEFMSIYISGEERVWSRLKKTAAAAAAKRKMIDAHEAHVVVERIISDENAHSIPPEARDYFAKELQNMASGAR